MKGSILCAVGFHRTRERKNGNATERICMRPGCEHREIYTVRKDGVCKYYREKKNHLVKKVLK
jgi:hypothetical protein